MAARLFVTCLALMLLAAPAWAQADNPYWLDEMSEQLALDHECEVGFLITMREYDIGTRHIEEATVQCVDGRRFDAFREAPAASFTIRPCGEQVC
ncbi:MAG: hypothetical protein WAT70_01930 [Rhizobiaceae bacterium]